jgi:hypothetical protein
MRVPWVVGLLVAILAPARADDGVGVQNFVAGLRGEADECRFLLQLCAGARASIGRAEGTPASADILASRQSDIAAARVGDAVHAARAIERKRGRRLPCFDEPVCAGIVPPAKPR